MFEAFKRFWNKVNPFDVNNIVQNIINESESIQNKIKLMVHEIGEIRTLINYYSTMLEQTELEARRSHEILDAISTCSPDMFWAKNIKGEYLYANRKIISSLLYSGSLKNTLGRTDRDIFAIRKSIVGEENHTFGDLFANSDEITIQAGVPMRFLESGTVGGELLIMQTYKNVIRNDQNEIIGTVGIGRNVTEDFVEIQRIHDLCTDENAKLQLRQFIDKNKFLVGGAYGGS